MPLKAEEAIALSDDAQALVQAFRDATDESGPQGKKLSRAERRKLLRLTTALAAQLVLEALD